MKPALKLMFVTLPLVALGAAVLAVIIANRPAPVRSDVAERATAVRVIEARQSGLAPGVTGYGVVRPTHVYEAIAQVGGTAEYVNPDLERGKVLPAGAVLVRLSQADFNLAIAQARANIRAAQARLAELDVSEKNLNAALDIELNALELKERDHARIQRLAESGTVSQTALDASLSGLLAQRQKVLNLENSLALLPTQRAFQKEQIAVYQGNLETAELNLARTELTLPFAARVAQRAVEVGQFIRAGQSAAVLDGVGSAEVEAQVPINDMLSLLRSGADGAGPASLGTEAMNGILKNRGVTATVGLQLGGRELVWPAEVERISDTIDQKSGTLGVIVRVATAYTAARPGERPPLTKGMFVAVRLSAAPLAGLVIPRSALRDGQVFLADENDRLTRVPVETLLLQDDVALVSGGLKPGARVVVSAPSPAIDGMLLEVVVDTELEARLAQTGQAR